MTFGTRIRQLREARGFSLRQLAKAIPIDPTYLSRVENEALPAGQSPKEETILRLAAVLEEDGDVLLGMAGKISPDIQAVIAKRPRMFAALIRKLRETPDDVLDDLVQDGEW